MKSRSIVLFSGMRVRFGRLVYPNGRAPARGWSLVVALHGHGGSGKQFESQTGFTKIAIAEKHAVLWLDGYRGAWNDGEADTESHRLGIDDVIFVDAALQEAQSITNIDAERIYVLGFSNGAMMGWRLAAERSHVFAAVGLSSGDVPNLRASHDRPVPAIYFHGEQDKIVLYRGGTGIGNTTHHSVDDTLAWARGGGAHVEFVPVEGGGHQWAGGKPISVPGAGACMPAPDQSAMCLRFFQEHQIAG